jgi:hypothetical protein
VNDLPFVALEEENERAAKRLRNAGREIWRRSVEPSPPTGRRSGSLSSMTRRMTTGRAPWLTTNAVACQSRPHGCVTRHGCRRSHVRDRDLVLNARDRPAPPRLALGPAEAAASLGVSREFFDTHVLPSVKSVRVGRRILIPIPELAAWLGRTAQALAHSRCVEHRMNRPSSKPERGGTGVDEARERPTVRLSVARAAEKRCTGAESAVHR